MTLDEFKAAQAAKKQQQKVQAKAQPQPTKIKQRTQDQAEPAQAAPPGPVAAPAEAKRVPAAEEVKAKEVEEQQPPPPEPKVEPTVVPEVQASQAAEADDWEAQVESEEASAPASKEQDASHAKLAEEPASGDKDQEVAPEPAAVEEPEEVEEAAAPVAVAAAAADDGKKTLAEPDPRPHLNVVFIGHVDAGKSTTCGNILYLSGCVDERIIEKYMKEAKDKNRESWFLAYIMDTNEEEKAKGKTVEVGRAHFETPNRRFTILDAPGHKSYVPNMISGASQADIGVLIISARKGEFETGFERGGQTREHALLAKTLGVDKLILAINKMDDPSVCWAKERFDEIKQKLAPFLKSSGFKDDQVIFLPLSGLTGDNIKERKDTAAWFTGATLLDTLDAMETPPRCNAAGLRIPMLDGFKDMGAVTAIGKVEQGTVKPGLKCIVMPIGHKCSVTTVCINDVEMQYALSGENVTLKLNGINEDQLCKGYVLCSLADPVRVVSKFKAQIHVIELPEERPVMTSGYKAVIHVHTAIEECEILKLYETLNMKDKKKEKNPRFCREGNILTCSIQLARPTAVDVFTGVQQLGRFTLRDEGRTIAIGKITELPSK